MDLGESFEEVAKREVFEETGLTVGNLKLLNVYSGQAYYLKVPNGDELYSATAVYFTKDISGVMRVDETESERMEYFQVNQLPKRLNEKDHQFICDYLNYGKDVYLNRCLSEK